SCAKGLQSGREVECLRRLKCSCGVLFEISLLLESERVSAGLVYRKLNRSHATSIFPVYNDGGTCRLARQKRRGADLRQLDDEKRLAVRSDFDGSGFGGIAWLT